MVWFCSSLYLAASAGTPPKLFVCFATMWRGEAGHEVGHPYTLCSMPKNEPHPLLSIEELTT